MSHYESYMSITALREIVVGTMPRGMCKEWFDNLARKKELCPAPGLPCFSGALAARTGLSFVCASSHEL